MKVPVLKNSLCGCSLRTGSICIAYVYLLRIGSLFFAYAYLVGSLTLGAYLVYLTYIDLIHGYYHYVRYVSDSVILAQIITAVLLLIGIYKKKLCFIFSWTVCSVILGVMVLMDILDYIYFLILFRDWESFMELSLWSLELAFRCYGLLVVHNHYKDILKNSKEEVETPTDAIQLV